MRPGLTATSLPFPLVARGKVRDVYDVGDNRLLLVATDRISAFDVVMDQPIPRKGEVLTMLTAWWLERLPELVPNHLLAVDPQAVVARVPELEDSRDVWARRAMLVRRTSPVPIECVVRGYLAGSAWAEYSRTGTLAGEPLPKGLTDSDRLERPIFSPATKAESGHDENVDFSTVVERLGRELAEKLREVSLAIYAQGCNIARDSGILVADTKFEFGLDENGALVLIDEVLTPDSSRFWPASEYRPGGPQPSLDKQPVRDFLESLTRRGDWDKAPPPPALPPEVVEATTSRYLEVFRRLTGVPLDAWPPAEQRLGS